MIFSTLKEDLKSKLARINPIFSEEKIWRRTHYILMADLIENYLNRDQILSAEQKSRLGTSISYATLRRFFEDKKIKNFTLDLRHIKTLDKLSIFLNYESFMDYSQKQGQSVEDEKKINSPDENNFFKIIKDFLNQEFKLYQKLPENEFKLLSDYLIENSPVESRMASNIERMAKQNLTLVQEGNRSNFEVIELRLTSYTGEQCIIETKEFWNLLFKNREGEDYAFNIINEQLYILHLKNTEWKLWDNFNPDQGNIKKKFGIGE